MPGNRPASLALSAVIFTVLAFAGGRGFRTQHLLEEHYAKYAQAFGRITQEQYLHFAQQLRDSHPGKYILEAKRPGGGGLKFERKRGWFVAYDGDGTLRTFFIPKDGVRFFERQARAAAPPE